MDQQYPTVAKIPVLDTGKFEQWQFRIQQYLQHEHYALWEVIEFGDLYEFPTSPSSTTTTDTTSGESGKKSGRTATLTAEDIQKKKNDVKARTTLLLSLSDEHQLRFSKYKTAREHWAAILKTFGGNQTTKKTKKNLLKQQYGNFKAEGSKNLEQTFNTLQVIVGQLQFMDVEVEQDDLNQKFLTSLAPEWLMHTIVWRNMSDLDTISLDDLYNHLKDINQIDEDDMEEVDIKWNMALLSMRADKIWKKTWKKISIQGSDVAGFDKSKVECFNCHKMGHFASECRAPRSQERGRRDNYKQGSKAEEQALKVLMAIDGMGWDWSYMENDEEDHALVADEVAPTEFALIANTSAKSKVFDNSLCLKDSLAQVESRLVEYKEREGKYCEKIRTLEFMNESNNECIEILKKKLETLKEEKEGVNGKLAGLITASKDLDNLIGSQRPDKNRDGLGYHSVPPPLAQLYLSPKKDLSWTGLPECADDTVTDYSRPTPTVESTSDNDQNRNPSVSKTVASPITTKPFIKFVKPKDSQTKRKTDETVTSKKPLVKSSNTLMDKENPWGKDGTGKDVDLHLYRSMIGSLMYLTASRPDLMFDVCACARHQVTPKECHLHAVKRIFRYLKGHPKLGLWYPKESLFDFVAYSDSDYGGATHDRKSTTGGCQFLGRRDCFEKKLISVDHIHTDENVVDLLTKPFDAGRFQYLVCKLFPLLGKLSTVSVFLDFRLTFAVLEKSEHNVDFHPMVDFIEASPPRRNLKLKDEEGISSLPDTELFENLSLMGYNISPNQKFNFQKAPRVTSPAADEGSMQRTISKLTVLCTSLQRQHSELLAKFQAQEVEINMLKERVKLLEDRDRVATQRSGDDTPIKGRSVVEGEAAAKRISDDLEEMATVLTSMDAATVLAGGISDVPTGSGSIPTASSPADEVLTGSDVVPTASPVFATATMVTPYLRRKGKEVMVESDTLKKQKVQEQIDAQVARELEEQLEREDQRRSEQIARDAKIARIHAEEELQIMIDGLDKNNETVAKYLQEYHQFASELPMERRIELISDLVKYQDNYAKVYKFQSQQRKPWTKKQKRDYYMAVIRSNLGWKEEAERFKRKGISFEQESAKKHKTSEEVTEEAKSPDEVPEEKVKEMMQLVPIEEVYVEALQVKHPIIDWKVYHEGQRSYWKITRKLYDSCRVHHVTSKDKKIFMLVEKHYPLRKGLILVMISYKLQVENYSQMANDLILKIYKITNSPRQQGD
nr:hypothetical protein [Tanacetum cinerariifolium]